jgi:uncharacterized membrane protein
MQLETQFEMNSTCQYGMMAEWLAGFAARTAASRRRSGSWFDMLNWSAGSWLLFLIALITLIVLVWMIVRLVARVNEDTDPATEDREMLLAMLDLHRQGDLSTEEFRSIKGQLVGRMRPGGTGATTDGTVSQPSAESSPVTSDLSDGFNRPILQHPQDHRNEPKSSKFDPERLQSEDSPNSDPLPQDSGKSAVGEMKDQNPKCDE